ncbi:MAG: bacillithiol biosynthesis BshC, partial [Terracidiphilus sp.]
LERIVEEAPGELTQLLAARSIPPEGKRRLAETELSLEDELLPLLDWMGKLDAGLGRSAETAASKMRYQMHRLRRLAANFQLQREGQLARQAEAISQALYPGGVLQERVHGAAYYFARYGFELAEDLTEQAAQCSGHAAIWL